MLGIRVCQTEIGSASVNPPCVGSVFFVVFADMAEVEECRLCNMLTSQTCCCGIANALSFSVEAREPGREEPAPEVSVGFITRPCRNHLSRLLCRRTDQSFCPDAKSQKEKDNSTNTCLGTWRQLLSGAIASSPLELPFALDRAGIQHFRRKKPVLCCCHANGSQS